MFNRLCIIGLGLIGGSIARSVKKNNLAKQISGFGREQDRKNLETALKLGVIDDYSCEIENAVSNAEAVIIATPVGSVEQILSMLKPYWSSDVIYSDVGSTKINIVTAAERVFGVVPTNLVPAHPIAGAEQSGVEAAVDSLFVKKRLIITPLPDTASNALEKIRLFWQRLGSDVVLMSAEHHDAVLAATSHLPHILAFTLVNMLGHKDEQIDIFQFAAGGFRDFTRIASSDPTMWTDICAANKNQIIPLLHELAGELAKIEALLVDDDFQQLFNVFTYARSARQRFLEQFDNAI